MGKPSSTNPERAAVRPFADRWGKTARVCVGLGWVICAAIGLLTTTVWAQTQATTLPLLLPETLHKFCDRSLIA